MGWTGTSFHGGSLEDFFKKEFPGIEFIRTSRTGGAFYAAYRTEENRNIRALVVLVKTSAGQITYKEMSEDMEPFYYACPEKILDILDPPESCHAEKWRAKCRQYIRISRTVRPGAVIRTEKPVSFRGGLVTQIFEIRSVKPWEIEGVNQYGVGFPVRLSRESLIERALPEIPEPIEPVKERPAEQLVLI